MTTATATHKISSVADNALPCAVTIPAFDAWLKFLPSLGFGDGCRQLFQALRSLNRTELPAHQRLQLMELLRPQVLQYCRRFDPYFLGQTFPLDDKIAKLVRLVVQFQAELALGYHRVTDAANFAHAFSKSQQTTAIERALAAYGLYLLRSAQCYESPMLDVWRKIQQIYRRAEISDIIDNQSADTDDEKLACLTPRQWLCKIAVFQLALPTRLSQRESAALYAWLDEHIQWVGLQHERAFNLQEADFYLDLADNAMPQPIGALGTVSTDHRFLFLNPQLLERLQSRDAGPVFGQTVACRLTPCREYRQGGRHNSPVLFAGGVDGIAALLAADVAKLVRRVNGLDGGKGNVLELQAPAQDARSRLSERVPQCFEPRPARHPQISREEIWAAGTREVSAAQHCQQGLMHFDAGNRRAMLIADRSSLRVGDFILMRGEGVPVCAGMIRAATPALDATRAFADVEVVSGALHACKAYLEGEQKRSLFCLLIGSEQDGGIAATIILPAMSFANGLWLTVEHQGEWKNLRLARLLEATAYFSHYQLVQG
ncbi:MAG: hypothetical protein EPN21_05350 [Methylococcaceae bacterium]|nr:MAG: hypothetical protein EPN21_05350 [Methylococcaceae bacterium]